MDENLSHLNIRVFLFYFRMGMGRENGVGVKVAENLAEQKCTAISIVLFFALVFAFFHFQTKIITFLVRNSFSSEMYFLALRLCLSPPLLLCFHFVHAFRVRVLCTQITANFYE